MRRSHGLSLLVSAILAACGAPNDDGTASDDVLAGSNGGIPEGSDEACAVLRVANEASAESLAGEVGVDARAAKAIEEHRLGADGKAGTEDVAGSRR